MNMGSGWHLSSGVSSGKLELCSALGGTLRKTSPPQTMLLAGGPCSFDYALADETVSVETMMAPRLT